MVEAAPPPIRELVDGMSRHERIPAYDDLVTIDEDDVLVVDGCANGRRRAGIDPYNLLDSGEGDYIEEIDVT